MSRTGDLQQRALDGFMWLSMGNGVRAVLKVAVLAVLARLLSADVFGLLAAATVVIWFSAIFSTVGIGPALVQRPNIDSIHIATAFSTSVVLCIVTGALCFLFAPQIAAVFRMPDLTLVLRAMSLIFPIVGLGAVSECLLQRELRFRAIATIELISYAIGYGGFGIGMAMLGWGVWALVGAELAKCAVKTGLALKAAPLPARRGFDAAVLRDLLPFGSGYTVSGLSTYFASQGDSFVVARFLGASALGVYGRAYELMMVPAQALGALLDKILFPTLAQVQREPARLGLAYRRCSALVALTVLPLAAGTFVLAPEIIRTLLGPGWEEVIVPLQILAFGMYFRVGYMVGQSVAHAIGAVKQTAWRNTVYAFLIVAGALGGQPYGVPGVAVGVVAAIVIHFGVVLQLSVAITGVRWVEVAELHMRAGLLAALLGLESWVVATLLRATEAPAIVTLALAACTLAATISILLRYLPRVLGADGVWIVSLLVQNVPASIRPFLLKSPAVRG